MEIKNLMRIPLQAKMPSGVGFIRTWPSWNQGKPSVYPGKTGRTLLFAAKIKRIWDIRILKALK